MASWTKNEVLPDLINGGQEFSKGDNLAVDELNAIVNNSFYATEIAKEALENSSSAGGGNSEDVEAIKSFLDSGFIKKPLQVSDTFFDNLIAEKTTEEITIDNVKEYFTTEPVIGVGDTVNPTGRYVAFLHNSTKIAIASIAFLSIDTDGSRFYLTSIEYMPKYSVVSNLQTTINNIQTTINNTQTSINTLQNSLGNYPTKSQVNGMFSYDETTKTLTITNLVV